MSRTPIVILKYDESRTNHEQKMNPIPTYFQRLNAEWTDSNPNTAYYSETVKTRHSKKAKFHGTVPRLTDLFE